MLNRRRFALAAPAALLAACALSACQDKPGAAAPPPAAKAPAQDLYALAAKGNGFTVGPMMAAHTVYVFFDPACPHCAHLWANAQSVTGKLKIVWLPIGFLRPQSEPIAATILGAPEPTKVMAENESSVGTGGRGITPASSLDGTAVAKVKANTELFKKFNADSVPLIVYRNAKTGEVGQHAGAVEGAELLAFAGL